MWDGEWWQHTCTYTYPHSYQEKPYMTQAGNLTTWLFRWTEGKTIQQYIMCPPLSGINRKARTSEIILGISNSIQNIENVTSIRIQQTGLLQYLWWQHTMGHPSGLKTTWKTKTFVLCHLKSSLLKVSPRCFLRKHLHAQRCSLWH